LLAHEGMRPLRWDLSAPQILRLLVLPMDMKGLLLQGGHPSSRLLYTDVLPHLLLPIAGLAGTALLVRRPGPAPIGTRPGKTDMLPLYGISLAVLLLFLLLVIKALPAPLLGISSWRQLYFVRVGFCLAALPLLSRWNRFPAPSHPRIWAVLLVLAGCLSGLWWGRPLRQQVPRPQGPEMEEVRALWNWLRLNHDDRWGRVYLQDTFMADPQENALAETHILALTSEETGVRQLGAFYGVMPFPTAGWANDLLFTGSRETAERKRSLRTAFSMTNCTHLVLSSPREMAALDDGVFLRRIWRGGRFAVYEVPGAAPEWAQPLTDGLQVRTTAYAPGRIEIDYDARGPGASFLLKEAYHPFWKVEGAPAVTLSRTAAGLIQAARLPSGRHRLLLRWKPPAAPWWLAGIGCLGLFAWSLRPRFHRTRSLGS
jgi:hypothetical protein